MKIKIAYPPNYVDICKKIPAVKLKKSIIFTYGDTIYNPAGNNLDPALIAHEEVHQVQQEKMGIENWWKMYLEHEHFRLDQEVQAYRKQSLVMRETYNRPMRRKLFKAIVKDLSGAMYGKIIDAEQAKQLIGGEE